MPRTLFHGAQYQGIANTIVQLIRRSTSGVIASSRPIRSDERHCKKQACPKYTKGKPKVSGLRLVHRRNTSPRWREPYGCQYNPRDDFRKNRGIVEGLALDRFAGPDGLMLLLSMIAEREVPAQELIELAKRVQIPGYEAVHELVHDAVSEGVIAPSITSGFYLQCEIWDVLKWAK